jgi:hypothetical protein
MLDLMGRSAKLRVQPLPNSDVERRANTRFAMTLEVRYTVLGGHGPAKVGSGRTIDLSSSGLRFIADKPLLTGQRIEVYIDWPARLYGDVKLQLVVSGVVIRTSETKVALEIDRHDFRTRSVGQRTA